MFPRDRFLRASVAPEVVSALEAQFESLSPEAQSSQAAVWAGTDTVGLLADVDAFTAAIDGDEEADAEDASAPAEGDAAADTSGEATEGGKVAPAAGKRAGKADKATE